MKLAILMAGYLRTILENINNIKKNIIQDYDCDIYIHITNDMNNDSKYINKNISIDLINDILNPKLMLVSNNLKFKKLDKINNILNQNYKFYWLKNEMEKLIKFENINYDIIIKTRPDAHVLKKIDFNNLNKEYVYIPIESKIDKNKLKNLDDKYICDIIAYGHYSAMVNYFNFYTKLQSLIDKYNNYVNESLLYYYLIDYKIQYQVVDIQYIVLLSLCNTIAITGDSGSGKTNVSNILNTLFNSSFVLECDRYHKWERNNENWLKKTHLNPDTSYLIKMKEDVFNLKIGNNIYQVNYDHKNGKFTNNELIEHKENIIVCGLHSLYLPEEMINLKIYMDTDDNLRIPWKIKRDISNRGYTINSILQQIENRKLDFKKYIFPQKEKSDIIINLYTDKLFNEDNFDINDEINILFKIGIKNTYNISNILKKIKIEKLSNINNYIYLYFKDILEYENIIKTIIININKNLNNVL